MTAPKSTRKKTVSYRVQWFGELSGSWSTWMAFDESKDRDDYLRSISKANPDDKFRAVDYTTIDLIYPAMGGKGK